MGIALKASKRGLNFQDFAVLGKMAKGRVRGDLKAYVMAALEKQGYVLSTATSVPKKSLDVTKVRVRRGVEKANEKSQKTVKPEVDAAMATRVAYMLSLAEDVFGDRENALTFLQRHHPMLGTTPLAKLETEWGGREVENILQSVIHGLPA